MARKKNETSPPVPKTEEEQAFDEQQQARFSKLKILRKRLKWYHILAAVIVLAIVALFVGWHFMPKKQANVVVLNKTVFSYSEDEDIIKENIYRKHQGLFWILNQRRFVKADGSDYDYLRDYYGPVIDSEGNVDHMTNLADADQKPDFLYLSDEYGLGNDTFGHYNGGQPLYAGISSDDMSYISFAHESGAPIVAEAALFSTPLSDSVYSQLVTLLGVTPTKWLGRYIVDLQDFTDVPDWAPPIYEQQEGVEWRFTGPGILLISTDGKIKILEQNTDFSSKDLLRIYINKDYKDEFRGCSSCNFYNWFELVEPNYGVENIATFEFDLNATGMEKIREISKTPRFCAITRKQEEGYAPIYFFAGDFNDYVNGNRYGCFLFSNEFFKFLSYDRQGDISNFFWRFYNPLIRHILDEAHYSDYGEDNEEKTAISRVNNGSFQVMEDGKWRSLSLKAMSVNAFEPGSQTYSRDFTFYEKLVNKADELGLNCLTAKTLLPPEFYTAVNRHNKNADRKIYILQYINKPEELEHEEYLTEEGIKLWKKEITTTLDALHGDGSAQSSLGGKATYFTDAWRSLLGVIVDPAIDAQTLPEIKGLSSYSYSGEYSRSANGLDGFASFLFDSVQKTSAEKRGYNIPAAVCTRMEMLKGFSLADSESAYSPSALNGAEYGEYFFDNVLLDSELIEEEAPLTETVYENYSKLLAEIKSALPSVLVTNVSVSNVNAIYGQDAVTEEKQGEDLTEILRAVKDNRLLGAVVYDLNDSWNGVSELMRPFTSAAETDHLWHNVCDSRQNTGVIALDSVIPETAGLVLSDDDLVQAVTLNNDAGYLYITLQLLEELDYKEHALFVGLDTFQRNDGEYYYSKEFTANSLSGMEYSLRLDAKQEGALYVINSYDRSRGNVCTKESYTGNYSKVADLTYGSFSSGDSQFYQTGSTIYIRLPWTWLNVADPSKKLVVNDKNFDGKQAKTVTTNGVLLSVMVGERKSGDLYYGFPEAKKDPGYKVYAWRKWDTVKYAARQKESYNILKKYFTDNQATE